MSPSAFWCQLLAFPLLHFWNQQALLKAQLLPRKDFISLCTSYPFRDRCHHGTIVGDHPVPVPSSVQLLQSISTCFMANQRGVTSCISFAFSCSIHTAASPDNTMIRDPRGVENLPCSPGRQSWVSIHLPRHEQSSLADGGAAGESAHVHLTPSLEQQPGSAVHLEGGRGAGRVCKLITERVCLGLFLSLAIKPEPLGSGRSRTCVRDDVVQAGVSQREGFLQPSRYTRRRVQNHSKNSSPKLDMSVGRKSPDSR